MLAQSLAFILRAEDASALQFRYYQFGKIPESTR